jgi:polar amino acid transport system substrate-binding protein
MQKKIHQSIVLGLLMTRVLTASFIRAEEPLSVEYAYQGEAYRVHGAPVNASTYRFNEGASKHIEIVTLDWPPYIGKDMCRQGWVQQLTVALLASQGYEIDSHFYPWARAVFQTESGAAALLYPEYYIEATAPSDVFSGSRRLDHLTLSKPFPGGPIAFMKRKGEADNYKGDLSNLHGTRIGVVQSYQNTPEFDRLMDKGFFKIDTAPDDFTNAKKLVVGRVDLILGDPGAIRWAVAHEAGLSLKEKHQLLDKLETVEPVLQYKHLYYAVSKKHPGWEALLAAINSALEEFESSGELHRIIQTSNADCGVETDPFLGQ